MSHASLSARDISVVVQGAIVSGGANGATGKCLQSVRAQLPGAEIILSTYPGSDVSGLTFDILVETPDPGATSQILSDPPQWNNVNRQIATSRAGLAQATRPYALKLRNDLLLQGDGFLRYFGKFPARSDVLRAFDERVVISTVYARNPRRLLPYAFHPSDWFFFGKTSDVSALFTIPLAPEPETSRYFVGRPRPVPDVFPDATLRFTPEQYLWLTFLRQNLPDEMARYEAENALPAHLWDARPPVIALSEASLINNFVLIGPRQAHIRFTKYPLTPYDWASVYTHNEWKALYQKHNAGTAAPLLPDWEGMGKRALTTGVEWTRGGMVRGTLNVLHRVLPARVYERLWKAVWGKLR